MKLKHAVIFILVFSFISLYGCVTEYGPRNMFGEGYSESRIGTDIYRVDFECSGDTPESLCDGFLFRRCAELTLRAGYDYFVMNDHRYDVREERYYVPGHTNTIVTGTGDNKKTTYTYTPGYTATKRSPIASATITMYKGMKPQNIQYVFDAREIMRHAAPANP